MDLTCPIWSNVSPMSFIQNLEMTLHHAMVSVRVNVVSLLAVFP